MSKDSKQMKRELDRSAYLRVIESIVEVILCDLEENEETENFSQQQIEERFVDDIAKGLNVSLVDMVERKE